MKAQSLLSNNGGILSDLSQKAIFTVMVRKFNHNNCIWIHIYFLKTTELLHWIQTTKISILLDLLIYSKSFKEKLQLILWPIIPSNHKDNYVTNIFTQSIVCLLIIT